MSDKKLGDIPGIHTATARTPAIGTSDATSKSVIFRAPFDCRISAIKFIPDTAITGADTNTRHLNIQDEGAAGTGDAEIANKDYTDGVDVTALVADDITMSSANHQLTEGDILTAEFEEIGTGQALPAGLIVVEFDADPNPA